MKIQELIINKELFKEEYLVNGKFISSEEKMDVINPANLDVLGSIPKCNIEQVREAVHAAKNAFPIWSSKTASERSKILKKWHSLILENKNDLAIIMTIEQGKPLDEAKKEIDYAASFVEWFAEEAKRTYGTIIPSPKLNQKIYVEHEAVGVVACLTPWNFPSSMITRKTSPALAAGCTIVLKPSDLTPFSAIALGVLAMKAGMPDGVFNIVTGDAEIIGKELTENETINKISFTGSTSVGKLLIKQCSSSIKRMSMELGGNAPFIIFADSDIDKTIQALIDAKFKNNGQMCISPNRVYIESSVYNKYLEKLITAVKKLKIGNGLDDVNMGPLISEKSILKLEDLIKDAKDKNAVIHLGGKKIGNKGYFFEPTIITAEINQNIRMMQEEIFGPILVLYKFDSEDEVLKYANATNYGLSAYFYTNNIHIINNMSKRLEYGIIGINEWLISNEVAPFGGIKQSGFGREGSYLGIKEYLNVKYICMSYIT